MSWSVKEEESKALQGSMNQTWIIDPNLVREPRRMIYIFSTSKREFTIERPPLFPMLRLRACGPDERWKMVAQVPDPFTQPVPDDNGRMRADAHDGWRVAIDLVNPNNISRTPGWNAPAELANSISTGEGCNLFRQGLFISANEVPTESEIAKAEESKRQYYDSLRMQIDVMNEKDATYAAAQNKDYGMMADYFGLSYPWHRRMGAMVACPNGCGERMQKGAPWHIAPWGPCINDWKRAVNAGFKKKEDVPEELRWWSDSEAQKASGAKAGR